MDLGKVFDVFSRRLASRDARHDIPDATRKRVLMWCVELFSNSRSLGGLDQTANFWSEMQRALRMRYGRLPLSDSLRAPYSPVEEVVSFLKDCDGSQFLDFVEYIFKIDCFSRVGLPPEKVTAELNQLLQADNLPYYVTDYVQERSLGPSPFGGAQVTTITTREYPRVVARENDALHTNVIQPTLGLLRNRRFASANAEYLEALEQYRKADYGDSLVKSCAAFESVLKVICELRGWPYQQTDTASTLVKTVLLHTNLDSYFEPVLMIVATLRNRLSKAHGAGASTRTAPKHLTAFALNMTGAAILMLAEETGLAASG